MEEDIQKSEVALLIADSLKQKVEPDERLLKYLKMIADNTNATKQLGYFLYIIILGYAAFVGYVFASL